MRKKTRIRKRAAALLAALLLLFAVAAAEGENLLVNPEITLEEGETLPEGWEIDMWDTSDGASLLDIAEDGRDGSHCLHVRNAVENDARFVQTVAVEPSCAYLLRGYIRASGCGEEGTGANLSAAYTFSYSPPIYETNGEWVKAELYGVTGESQTELTVMARLGGYGSITTGEAWFDSIELIRLDAIPEGVTAQPLGEETYSTDEEEIEPDETETGSSKATILISAVFALGAMALCLYVARRAEPDAIGNAPSNKTLPALLFVALIARVSIALLMRGFETDMGCYLAWASRVARIGPGAFYEPGYFCDYPPGYLYVLWLTGEARNLFGLTADSPGAWLITKLPCILADIGACAVLYAVSRKDLGERCSVALAALYAFNPAVILDSAAWGQTDGLLALFIVIAIWYAAKAKWTPALLIFALAVLVKPQALLFAPIGLFMLIAHIVRAKIGEKNVLGALLSAIGAFMLLMLVSLPFTRSQTSEWYPDAAGWLQPFLWLIEKYAKTLGSYPYYTVNACNLWQLLGRNWVELRGGAAQWFGWGAYALAFGFGFWLYAKSKAPKRAFLLSATVITIIFCFGLKMHERYLMPAILLLCMAYTVDRDIRICVAAILLSCAQYVNAALVLEYIYLFYAPGWLAAGTSVTNILGCALLIWTSYDLCAREKCVGITRIYRPSAARMGFQEKQAKRAAGSDLFREPDAKIGLNGREKLTVLAITALYSAFALINLGATTAPQTSWTSSAAGESVTFDIGDVRSFHMTYYGGICDTNFTVQFSSDGESYTEPAYALYNQGEIFRWLWYRPMVYTDAGNLVAANGTGYETQTARYIRITAQDQGLVLSEVAFLSEEGKCIPVVSLNGEGGEPNAHTEPMALIDEQQTVPASPSYYNGTYFDEIYHARTAYEHINGMHAYEWTHPPLGKLLIAVGIQMFGMTPFGWRFMGALAGILMVPLMYLMARQLTKNRFAAFFAMMLMTLDCMHFTQTRIATIDSFAVLFIMLMYLFMFRYVKMSFYHDKLSRTFVPLALCGVSFALGCATKWICIYAGAGLAILFFYSLSCRYAEYRYAKAGMRAFAPEEKRTAQRAQSTFVRNSILTIGWCVLFFIAVPVLIYYFSYYWQLTPDGNFTPSGVIELQKTIFRYHKGLSDDTHYFRSPWYEWPLIIKPMWYYSGTEFQPDKVVSSISCMGNPAVWWGGLVGLIYVFARIPASWRKNKRNALLAVGFLSQFAPWILVPRSTFIYHYFASVPFLILCAMALIEDLCDHDKRLGVKIGSAWMGAALALLAGFYPLMSGTPFPLWWAKLLRWFNWYNF